jgi:putative flippase GtrA
MSSELNKNNKELVEEEAQEDKDVEKDITSNIKEFLSYVLLAGIATLVDMGLLFLLTEYLFHFTYDYLIAGIISYLCGMITNYSLNKYITFKNTSKRIAPQFGIFSIIALIGLGLNELILWFFTEFTFLNYIYAKVLSVGIVMIWSYFGHRKFTFKIFK